MPVCTTCSWTSRFDPRVLFDFKAKPLLSFAQTENHICRRYLAKKENGLTMVAPPITHKCGWGAKEHGCGVLVEWHLILNGGCTQSQTV